METKLINTDMHITIGEHGSQETDMKTDKLKQKKITAVKPAAVEPIPNTIPAPIISDWEINGWMNRTKTGKSVTISAVGENGESILMGFINISQIAKVLHGQISGTPIKCPPNADEPETED